MKLAVFEKGGTNIKDSYSANYVIIPEECSSDFCIELMNIINTLEKYRPQIPLLERIHLRFLEADVSFETLRPISQIIDNTATNCKIVISNLSPAKTTATWFPPFIRTFLNLNFEELLNGTNEEEFELDEETIITQTMGMRGSARAGQDPVLNQIFVKWTEVW